MISNPVVSVHFPKTGGVSLRTQLLKLLGDTLLLDYDHDPLTPTGNETAPFPEGKRLVHGHFKATRYSAPDAYWMTFLREPVGNLISIYFFWRYFPESGNPVHARFLREKPSILEFARYPGLMQLMSDTYFGGFDMRRFDFIGFHDSRRQDVVRLASELDLPLDPDLRLNDTVDYEERKSLVQDDKILGQLRDILIRDINFYEDVKSIAANRAVA